MANAPVVGKRITDGAYWLGRPGADGHPSEFFAGLTPAGETDAERDDRVNTVLASVNEHADLRVIAEWAAKRWDAIDRAKVYDRDPVRAALQRLGLLDG